jgi:hypothetical protein
MSNSGYTPLPVTNEQTPYTYTEEELRLMKRSSGFVIFLAFVQLCLAFFTLLAGGILIMCVSTLFISIGIVGAVKRNMKLVIVHFVYSLVLYILSVVGLVLFVFYSTYINWYIYIGGFFLILFQAIGIRHSRILIGLLRKSNPCASRCGRSKRCNNDNVQVTVAENNSVELQQQPQQVQEQAPISPSAPQMPAFYPGQQMIAVPYMPQYFPLQPANYSLPQQPFNMVPMVIPPQYLQQQVPVQQEGQN